MKKIALTIAGTCLALLVAAQGGAVKHLSKLEIGRKQTETFTVDRGKDSSLTLVIDTLIMKSRAHLKFFGMKDVKLRIGYAEMDKQTYISGTDSKNNGTNMDIDVHFGSLGSLSVLAGGYDATNGTRTFPNGNGGNVKLKYDPSGVVPQTNDKKNAGYLQIDTRAGGYRVNPRTDLANIYSRIYLNTGRPLGQLPQGQIYSGTPGRDGEKEVTSK